MRTKSLMRAARAHPWLSLAMLASARATYGFVSNRVRRRHLLRQGAIRHLDHIRLEVEHERIFARCAITAERKDQVPVVFVHGWGISSAYFIPTAERLATEFDVYVPDLPGHGWSSTPKQPLDVPSLARALVTWLDTMGIERAVLVGHSMGCQIVVEAAVRHASRVERLILIGPTTDPAARRLGSQFGRMLLSGQHERSSLRQYLLRDYLRMNRRLKPELHAMLKDEIEAKLPEITQPVLLVRGEKDHIVPQRWIEEMAQLIGDARIEVIPGWGHAVQYSAADELVPLLRLFLRDDQTSAAD